LSPLRELSDRGGNVRPRRQLRDERFDLPRRPMRRPLEERRAVVRGQEGHEPRQAAQLEPAIPERLQDLWVLPCRAGYRDAR